MVRVKCKKCLNVYEQRFGAAAFAPHIGHLHYVKCPVCSKRSWVNIYSSTKDPLTWPPEAKEQEKAANAELELTEEELEKKRIEESKYEKP